MDPRFQNPKLDLLCGVIDATKALFVRGLFLTHSIITVWASTCSTGNPALWALLTVQGVFVAETIYAIYKRKGREPKWISPCMLLYLMTVIPPIWILNLKMFECLHLKQVKNETCSTAGSCGIMEKYTMMDQKAWTYTLEQVMLLLLILGRWLLPKGNISRDKLSSLLLVYFGMAFDIMELFQLYQEPAVIRTYGFQYFILTLWSVSLFQFSLVLTNTKTRRVRLSLNPEGLKLQLVACCQSDLWSIAMSVFMQDAPFLVLRIYCLAELKVYSYDLMFYTSKNILVLMLQIYRIMVLCCKCREEVDIHKNNIAESITSSNTDLRGKIPTVTMNRPQRYTIDRAGKVVGDPSLSLSRAASTNTLNSLKDHSFVTSV